MASKVSAKVTFEPQRVIQPFFTGGSVALDESGHLLATTLDEEVVLTDLRNGNFLARIEGVRTRPLFEDSKLKLTQSGSRTERL